MLNDYIINVSESPSEDDVPPEGIIVKNELIRNFRPPHLEYRIGDVILTRNMVVGAIIGWSIDMAVRIIITHKLNSDKYNIPKQTYL